MEKRPGKSDPLGLSFEGEWANFSLLAPHAHAVTLCLFSQSDKTPDVEIPLNQAGSMWHIELKDLPKKSAYAYRIDGGPLVSDPYAKAFSNHYLWKDFSKSRLPRLCSIEQPIPFDWEGVQKPNLPLEDLVIYEMHVRGFTQHPSSDVSSKGTYAGLVEKIDYLKKLGVTAVELMPVFEFDETHSKSIQPTTKEHLPNYWGYHPISFFIPMSRFAKDPTHAITEFKTLVRELHRAGIEVFLDVVYNHTGEDENYIASWRGIDRAMYYMLDSAGKDRNYTGCGNTFQVNGSAGQKMIFESLHYWAREMQIDGFRFDLASILTRGVDGKPLNHPPILELIAQDPLLKTVKLIAEPWDAAGLYQVGQFPRWGHWSGWNGLFRDHIRRFIKGTDKETGPFATAICGSETFYGPAKTPLSSINFITAHDGFCLQDLVSYQDKHNLENGESNRDGANQNDSWNCDVEGPTNDPKICALRERQVRNFLLALLTSQGIPMLVMGDELGQTRKGNNNPYVQDNDLNWMNWTLLQKNQELFHFVSDLIGFRKQHPLLRRTRFLTNADVDWHGHQPNHPDWSDTSRFVAFTLKDKNPLYIAFNAYFQKATISLPANFRWHLVVDTSKEWSEQNFAHPEKGALLSATLEMPPYSALVAKAF